MIPIATIQCQGTVIGRPARRPLNGYSSRPWFTGYAPWSATEKPVLSTGNQSCLPGPAGCSQTEPGLTICIQSAWIALRNHKDSLQLFLQLHNRLNDRPIDWSSGLYATTLPLHDRLFWSPPCSLLHWCSFVRPVALGPGPTPDLIMWAAFYLSLGKTKYIPK